MSDIVYVPCSFCDKPKKSNEVCKVEFVKNKFTKSVMTKYLCDDCYKAILDTKQKNG